MDTTGFVGRRATPPRPCAEAQVMELRQIAARYAAGCPFKPGDLVTPLQGYNDRGAGEPHVVLEVPAEPVRLWTTSAPSDIGSPDIGERLDMRVACLAHVGEYLAYWAPSWRFAAWTPDTSADGAA